MTTGEPKLSQERYEAAKKHIDLFTDKSPCIHNEACGNAVKLLPDCLDEIERLRGLVENAFFEGMYYGNPDSLNPDQQAWIDSESRKALEKQ